MFFDFLRCSERIIFIKNSSAEHNCAQLCLAVLNCAQLCSILAQLGSIVLNYALSWVNWAQLCSTVLNWAQLCSYSLNCAHLCSTVLNWAQLCSNGLNCAQLSSTELNRAQLGSNIALLGISETMKNMKKNMNMNKSLFLKRIALRALKNSEHL